MQARFTVSTPTIVSLFSADHSWLGLRASIISNDTGYAIFPQIVDTVFNYQALTYYLINATTPEEYLLDVSYRIPTSYKTCPFMALGFFMKPLTEVEESVECHPSKEGGDDHDGVEHNLPSKNLGTRDHYFQVSSFFNDKDIKDYTTGGAFEYAITFSITENSDLDTQITYDSLNNLFVLELYYKNSTGGYVIWSEGSFDTVSQSHGEYSNMIDATLYKSVATDYKLVISQGDMSKLYNFGSQRKHCYLYFFTFQCVPKNNPVHVRSVVPAELRDFNPREKLKIQLTFSGPLFDGNKKPITRDSFSALLNAVKLVRVNSSSFPVHPIEAYAPVDNVEPDDLTQWVVVFGIDKLAYDGTYELSFEPNSIFSSNDVAVTLPSRHRYSMIASDQQCGPYGVYNPAQKKCVCDFTSHREGERCEKCIKGYTLDENNVCTRPFACLATSCGCTSASMPSYCIPIGVCSSPDGVRIVCDCPKNYRGRRCEACAPNYTNYPDCTPECNPPCSSHGKCDPSTRTCKCDKNFDGPTCVDCAPGKTGADCSVPLGSAAVKYFLVVVGIVLLIVGGVVGAWIWKRRQDAKIAASIKDEILRDGSMAMQNFVSGNNAAVDKVDLSSQNQAKEKPKII